MDSAMARAIERFDLAAYVRDLGGAPAGGDHWELTCPRCFKLKIVVNARKKVWHCWSCETKGPPDATGRCRVLWGGGGVIRLLCWLHGWQARDAGQYLLQITDAGSGPLAHLVGELDAAPMIAPGEHEPVDLPLEAESVHEWLPYLRRRRVELEDAQRFGLMWCASGRYAQRLIFPVWQGGRALYWQARAMWEKEEHGHGKYIKCLNPPRQHDRQATARDVLFNLEQAARYRRICLTEGPLDAMRVGIDAVCSFGKVLHSGQVGAMVRAGVQAVDLMWDGPGPTEPRGAWDEMAAVAPMLAQFFAVRLCWLPWGDPDNHDRAYLGAVRAGAKPLARDSGLEYLR